MGGSSKSSSSSTQETTTRDERIAASDSATVIKDAFQNLTNITMTSGEAFGLGETALNTNERIALAVIEGAGAAINQSLDQTQTGLDKLVEFVKNQTEKTTTDTTGAQKLMPWLMGGVAVIALSKALRK